jgi:hypothetical protein
MRGIPLMCLPGSLASKPGFYLTGSRVRPGAGRLFIKAAFSALPPLHSDRNSALFEKIFPFESDVGRGGNVSANCDDYSDADRDTYGRVSSSKRGH